MNAASSSHPFKKSINALLQAVENLYGQDLDSGHHGSGFPLPPSRKKQLEELLAQKVHNQQDKAESPEASEHSQQTCITYTPEEQAYSEHCWNINNLPRCKVGTKPYILKNCDSLQGVGSFTAVKMRSGIQPAVSPL